MIIYSNIEKDSIFSVVEQYTAPEPEQDMTVTTTDIEIIANVITIPIGTNSSLAAREGKFNLTTPLGATQTIVIDDSGDGERFTLRVTANDVNAHPVITEDLTLHVSPDFGRTAGPQTTFIQFNNVSNDAAIFSFEKYGSVWHCDVIGIFQIS